MHGLVSVRPRQYSMSELMSATINGLVLVFTNACRVLYPSRNNSFNDTKDSGIAYVAPDAVGWTRLDERMVALATDGWAVGPRANWEPQPAQITRRRREERILFITLSGQFTCVLRTGHSS